GRNRMNIYTIRRVVYGLGNYLLKNNVNVKDRGVVVAYDSRHMSQEFAVEVAKVIGTFGIKTHIFTSLRPTPHLSFAIRYLGVVVAYDARETSQDFAVEVTKVLGIFGIKTHIFTSRRPTPLLSFAIRYLGTVSGIMITASHNPPEYNGFKVYNDDGGQLVPRD